MLVQRISALAVCSALLVACGTNNVKETGNVPVADTINTSANTSATNASAADNTSRYVTEHKRKLTAQQHALQQQQTQVAAKRKQQWEQNAEQQRQQWAQEHTRKQREAQKRYEEEKNRITRLKYHQKYEQEQIRLAQEKLKAEELRLVKLQYQRKFEADQKRKEYERKAAEQKRLADQKAAKQRWVAEQKLAKQRRLVEQQETAKRQKLAREQKQKNDKIRARSLARYNKEQAKKKRGVAVRPPAQRSLRLAGGQRGQRGTQQYNQQVAYQPRSNMFRGAGRHRRLPGSVAKNLRLRGVSSSGMSAYVRPANGRGPAVLTAAADTPRNPASTMKLVTTYAALGALGPNYQWPTEIYITGPVRNGTLQGDVVIKGYGNPNFRESDLKHLLGSLRHRGIRNITGNLVADTSYFSIPHQRPGSFDGKSGAAYNAQPEALLYQGRGSGYRFKNLSKRVKRHTRKMPRGKGARRDLNTNLFGAFWKVWVGKMGGDMKGRFRKGRVPQGAQLVYRHQSRPLRNVLPTINKKSNNVMARQLMLTVGAQTFGAPGTPGKGAMAIGRFMESRGLNFPELRIENGSGLSRVSRISARNLGEMLVNAYNSPWRNDFMNSLAILGVDGTMRNRMRKSGLAGRGHFKTGTLRDVRGLAGYVQASNGQTYVVSILHNDRKARSKAKGAHDELVKWVYWGPRNNFAGR